MVNMYTMARNSNKFIQGKLELSKLQHPEKYKCKNPIKGQACIVYRSSWEKSFMSYCDKNDNVLEWSSEEYQINYINSITGKPHRYFPDFWMKVRNGSGKIKEFIIEVKPMKETMDPQQIITEGMSERTKTDIIETYVKNRDKWDAAEQFCKSKGWNFKVLTEHDIVYVKRHMKNM
jgi:hypothetical protein